LARSGQSIFNGSIECGFIQKLAVQIVQNRGLELIGSNAFHRAKSRISTVMAVVGEVPLVLRLASHRTATVRASDETGQPIFLHVRPTLPPIVEKLGLHFLEEFSGDHLGDARHCDFDIVNSDLWTAE
jgi:hypothetical protein